MHSLASCCTHKGASDACTPYQRLPRSPAFDSAVDAHSNRFLYHVDAASSRSDSFAANKVDFQRVRSGRSAAAASSSLSDNSIKPHHNVCPQSKHVRCDEAGGVALAHRTTDCTIIKVSTPTEIKAKEGIISSDDDANTVLVKIGIVGDTETGKSSFMAKYGGMQMKHEGKEWKGVTLLQKVCKLHSVNIALHIWDLGGFDAWEESQLAESMKAAETKPKRKFMGRKKVCPETLRESGTQRKETFGKRTRGLFKKAHELANMCGCPVYVAVGGEDGRIFLLHRLRNPHLDRLSTMSSSTTRPTTLPAAHHRPASAEAPSPFLLESGMHVGNEPPTPLPPASATPSLWFYNHKSEKMEYSGLDCTSTVPTDPPFSLLCPPYSCRCPDCLCGRSRFVGRVNSRPPPAAVSPPSLLADADFLNTPLLINPYLDDDISQLVRRTFPPTNHLHGFVDNLPNINFPGFSEETLNALSGPNSAESSPEVKNEAFPDIGSMYNSGVRVKEEPVDDPFNEDLFLPSSFDAWFDQDFKP